MTVDAEQKVQKARDLLEDIVDKNKRKIFNFIRETVKRVLYIRNK